MSSPLLVPDTTRLLLEATSRCATLRIGDLGTFVRKEQPARWDPESGVIHPPMIALDFSKTMDGPKTFSDYLHQNAGMNAAAAEEMAYKLQHSIVTGLNTVGSFEIPGFGKITKTASGEFSFYTDELAIQFLDERSFGLRKVKASRTSISAVRTASSGKKHDMKALSTEKISPKGRLFGWKFFLVTALMGALGFLVVQYGPWDFSQLMSSAPFSAENSIEKSPTVDQPQPADLSAAPLGVDDHFPATTSPLSGVNPAAENAASPVDQPTEAGVDTANDNVTTTQRMSPPLAINDGSTRGVASATNSALLDAPVSDMGVFRGSDSKEVTRGLAPIEAFHLIAGSFNSLEGAQQFVTQLQAEGYDPTILQADQELGEPFRVSIYQNKDRQKVSTYADKLKQMGKKAGWVYAFRPVSR